MADETTTPQAEPAAAAPQGGGTEAPAAAPAEQQQAPAPPSMPSYQGGGAGMRRPAKRFPRRKVCAFCVEKIDYIDYKDAKRLRKFVSERGKIVPRRISGNCAAHQRLLTTALKRARVIALIPYTVGE